MKSRTKGQIRDSDVVALQERVAKEKYQYYLKSMDIVKLRGLVDTSIRFDFPVTAIVGPNGSGKSTVLGAAGLICRELQPRIFFARSGSYDADMKDWRVEYKLLQPAGDDRLGKMISRTANYRQAKWNRDAIDRPVKYVGIFRTIPAAERKSLNSFVGGAFEAKNKEELSSDTRRAVQNILGKPADSYIKLSNSPNVGTGIDRKAIYASSPDAEGGAPGYSEFHFGAGEASIISIVDEVEGADLGALILIEELENGLHPVATRRLVEYLIEAAKRKSCQVIFTTHSNDALSNLPSDAVWSVSRGKLYQGKLDVSSLRALTGEISTNCAIFTEDTFSKQFAEKSLRVLPVEKDGKVEKVDLSQIEIHPLGGESQVRSHTTHHNQDPTIDFPVVGFLDGDQKSHVNEVMGSYRGRKFQEFTFAPGDSHPELAIYEDVLIACRGVDGIQNPLAKLSVILNMEPGEQRLLLDKMEEVFYHNLDPHLLFEQLGEQLYYLAATEVAAAFIDQWCRIYPQKLMAIWEGSLPVLPLREIDPD